MTVQLIEQGASVPSTEQAAEHPQRRTDHGDVKERAQHQRAHLRGVGPEGHAQAELAARLRARFSSRHAGCLEFLGPHVEVERELFVDVRADVRARSEREAEETSHTGSRTLKTASA